MIRLLKEIYGLVYREPTQTAAVPEPLHRETERIKSPLKDREDFEEIREICLEVSCVSQEYGLVSGFRYGVTFMVECMEWPGQE